MRKNALSRTFLVEAGLFVVAAVNVVLTLLWRDWIEVVFRVDPDNHSGAFEWALVVTSLAAAMLFGTLARREWRRLAAMPG
jgi:hypothetical protein